MLLVGTYLALDPAGYDISLLGDETYLMGDNEHPPKYMSLGVSTTTGHTST